MEYKLPKSAQCSAKDFWEHLEELPSLPTVYRHQVIAAVDAIEKWAKFAEVDLASHDHCGETGYHSPSNVMIAASHLPYYRDYGPQTSPGEYDLTYRFKIKDHFPKDGTYNDYLQSAYESYRPVFLPEHLRGLTWSEVVDAGHAKIVTAALLRYAETVPTV